MRYKYDSLNPSSSRYFYILDEFDKWHKIQRENSLRTFDSFKSAVKSIIDHNILNDAEKGILREHYDSPDEDVLRTWYMIYTF